MAVEDTRPSDPLLDVRAAVEASAEALHDREVATPRPTLERPPSEELGDYSTNAALLLAPIRGEQPRQVAEALGEEVRRRLGGIAKRVEIAGPGFLNLFLADRWYREQVGSILAAGERYGVQRPEHPERILIEFVSANPTGPLTVASGRGAAFGDSLARLLEHAGHAVEREYYLNDTGGQIVRFAESIAARMRGEEPPEDGYGGPYVADLADGLQAQGADPGDLDVLSRLGTEAMREWAERTLEHFRVRFDRWLSERSLHDSGAVSSAIEALREAGHVYQSEGATWLRTTEFGDDKDRVLVRSGGEPTYFASDVAYHRDKLDRADRLINPLGADHHGYVARLRAAIQALGADPDRFEAPLLQLVHVIEGGERAQMSKRTGEFVTLDELVDDIGIDAARFFLVQRSHETTIDLDLELARRESADNPVYYVQYAHARIASILRRAAGGGDPAGVGAAAADATGTLEVPLEPSERALVKRLLELPEEVRTAAELRAPHRLCAYAAATAADFHAFYRDCKVIGAPGEGTEAARLAVCLATKQVIATTLGLLGVEAPERM